LIRGPAAFPISEISNREGEKVVAHASVDARTDAISSASSRAGDRRSTPMQIIWLILAVVGTTPIHVGNFPDMDTCQAAAMSSRGQVTGGRPGSMSYLWMCVQANTGKSNDPPPP
jgi:hypothetical protein